MIFLSVATGWQGLKSGWTNEDAIAEKKTSSGIKWDLSPDQVIFHPFYALLKFSLTG